jgi:hypothetical protein
MKRIFISFAGTVLTGGLALAQTPGPLGGGNSPTDTLPPVINHRGPMNPLKTPAQKESDLQSEAKVRASIQNDRTLSDEAKKVQVTAKDGIITLSGQVPSQSDKSMLESKAATIVGASKVSNEIEVQK